MGEEEYADNGVERVDSNMAYNLSAVAIFVAVALNFLFPSNRWIPMDRRTIAILGATMCYITRSFAFPNRPMDLIEAVDFDVLVLLSGIMAINHIIVHLKETKTLIVKMQSQIQRSPVFGFWLVSIASFLIAPFLTNDGVCLLFVEIILNAFKREPLKISPADHQNGDGEEEEPDVRKEERDWKLVNVTQSHRYIKPLQQLESKGMELQRSDAVYFMLTLACSANIGSALTYTGNPQNMIVAQDSIDVLPPLRFFAFMFLPSLMAWLMTTAWIQRCWMLKRAELASLPSLSSPLASLLLSSSGGSPTNVMHGGPFGPATADAGNNNPVDEENAPLTASRQQASFVAVTASPSSEVMPQSVKSIHRAKSRSLDSDVALKRQQHAVVVAAATEMPLHSPRSGGNAQTAGSRLTIDVSGAAGTGGVALTPNHAAGLLSPRRQRIVEREAMVKHIIFVISSPFPYMMVLVLVGMIVMTFVNVMSITGLVCVTAVIMVTSLVFGNLWLGRDTWTEVRGGDVEEGAGSATANEPLFVTPLAAFEDRIASINEFFEALFNSLDYSLLFIFLGLFVVVANIESTGIPKQVWAKIVGDTPFNSPGSIIGISIFVMISSQLIGNVAVVQLAKPNVEVLGDRERALAWAMISYIATVAGNLTITGSAANIIVAEKASRLDAVHSSIDFYRHLAVCFGITLLSCTVGACMLVLLVDMSYATTG